jgi:ribosomal protein S18 acetylase RimI-like enzyme
MLRNPAGPPPSPTTTVQILSDYVEERILSETPNVFLSVSSFNKRAQKLYERRGYEVVGELKNYIVPGHSEILLRKTIAPLTEFKRP